MKESNLVFGKDSLLINEKLDTSIGRVVMDRTETPLMKRYSEIVTQNGGDILECGFGMGISADFIYNSNINSYTCIEVNDEIFIKALEWSKDKTNVTILHGDWVNILPTISRKFDGIFHDTHMDPNFLDFETYCEKISNENCVLSIFGYTHYPNSIFLENEIFKMDSKLEYLGMDNDEWLITYSFFNNGSFKKRKQIKTSII
jgi:hypothetical protein